MKRFPVTLFNIHSRSVGSVSPSEQLDRPRFRANFSRWGPGGLDLNLPPIRAVLRLRTTRSIRVSSGFDYLRTDQMFGPMPILRVIHLRTAEEKRGNHESMTRRRSTEGRKRKACPM